MEPLFTNRTTMDAAACRRFLALTWGKNAGALRWVLAGTSLLALAYGALQLAARGLAGLPYALAVLLLGGVAAFLAVGGWRLRAGGYIRAQQALWGGDTLDKTVEFYPDRMEQKTRLGKLSFGYGQVTRVRERRGAVLVEMGASAMLLSAGGFGLKTAAEFMEFIQGKIAENNRDNIQN